MTDDVFEPDDLQFQESDDDQIRMIFAKNSGEHRTVVVRRENLASLFAGIQRLLPAGDAVPIDRDSFRAGTTIRVTSYQFSPRETEFRMTLFVDLPDQGRSVTIPLHFSRKDAKSIIEQLQNWLESREP